MPIKTAPFGTWKSPLTVDDAVSSSKRFGGLNVSSEGPIWLEGRAEEGGRGVLVQAAEGELVDLTDQGANVRSTVHEYGGASFICENDRVFFINASDQGIYELVNGQAECLLTLEGMRFADCALQTDGRRLFFVCEKHAKGSHHPENLLGTIELGSPQSSFEIIAKGHDFYAAPRPSPDQKYLAWLQWDLPFMPWDWAQLAIGHLNEDGTISDEMIIAGGSHGAAFQPLWGIYKDDPNALYFVEERDNWSGLYVWTKGSVKPVFTPDAELMRPLWALGSRSYTQLKNGRLLAIALVNGEHQYWLIDQENGTEKQLKFQHRHLSEPIADKKLPRFFAFASDDDASPAVVCLDVDSQNQQETNSIVMGKRNQPLLPEYVSIGKTLSFDEEDGQVHALYYEPTNADFQPLKGEKPPMIVSAHGGPTGMADRGLKTKIQFWTSRGFAFLDVDYRGSFGYGSDYRKALDGYWGIIDGKDVEIATLGVVEKGLADQDRLLISGSSAGGFTALNALVQSDIFRAASIAYGVADLESLLATTHKFEAGYIFTLTGTNACNTEPVFSQRSPLKQANRISSPVLVMQGKEDKVVPPEQSRDIVDSLRQNGVPVSLLEFDHEGHGFRRAENIKTALLSEYAFYAQILDLKPADELPILQIENLR